MPGLSQLDGATDPTEALDEFERRANDAMEIQGGELMDADELAKVTAERDASRSKVTELNRRCQMAEAALADLQRCSAHIASGNAWCGGNMGRAFLAYANQQLREALAGVLGPDPGAVDRARTLLAAAEPMLVPVDELGGEG